MNNNIANDIQLFFEDTKEYHPPPRNYGVLYLLRRDVSYCIGESPEKGKAIFPATMGILAGIDLLGKFLAGNDARGRVGERFKKYIDTYFELDDEKESNAIYQLRNSLLHSFGLYSEDNDNIYHFQLVQYGTALILEWPDTYYRIDVRTLYGIFDKSINKYYNDLIEGKDDLQSKFSNMFAKYGKIHIG